MFSLTWYWHRLRAMSVAEVALHARKKLRQWADAHREGDWTSVELVCSGAFPRLPPPQQAPALLRDALRRERDEILAGRWRAFGHLPLQVDDPPKWHCDYLVGRDLASTAPAYRLNHRALGGGADIKLIWELSRWYQLVRLAMAAYVLDDQRAAHKCVTWLQDWVKHNPPYRGWNWTSALEAGMRLIQFAWMDALLFGTAVPWASEGRAPQVPRSPPGSLENGDSQSSSLRNGVGTAAPWANEWATLRYEILPPHVWHVWRNLSFGSSANNHLIGELAGLIVATARWPALAHWGAPLEELQRRWEREVLAQFAQDGGNREQALNYHLFSWEFCWQTRLALQAAGREVPSPVEQRLERAARFFWEAQARRDPWDYGDSDSAWVTPLFATEATALIEWRDWLSHRAPGGSLAYWLGESGVSKPPLGVGPPAHTIEVGDWWVYPESGIALAESGFWWLRWDLSPLGYLSTAAHGHLDALHLSVWYKGVALVIDPGTGCYLAHPGLRAWFASRAAHNGPCPVGLDYPKRLGCFLWAEHHPKPTIQAAGPEAKATWAYPGGVITRRVRLVEGGRGWQVTEHVATARGDSEAFEVRWQFAPGCWVKRLDERKFTLRRAEVSVVVEVDARWSEVELVEPPDPESQTLLTAEDRETFEGWVSPAFRKLCPAPLLKLKAPAGPQPCHFTTTFLASAPS